MRVYDVLMPSKQIENLSHYQEFERYLIEMEPPTKLGEALTIVGHPFADPVSNFDLLNMAKSLGLPEHLYDQAESAIQTTGFTNRYFSRSPLEFADPAKAFDRVTDVGAILLNRTLRAHGWEDGFDVFIDTSAFLPTSVNHTVLQKAGFTPDTIYSRSYRYACAGAVGAFIDCLSDPDMAKARVVIGSLEPLSLLLDQDQFTKPGSISFPAIFGDANTFMAFTPERFHLQEKQILIQPDGGVIKLVTDYNFEETPSRPESIPDHYHFANGGEHIFHHSADGAYLNIPVPDNGSSVSMDGKATGFFFGDKTTGLIMELLESFGNRDLLKELHGQNLIMHPASKPVVDRIAKLLYRGKYRYLDTPQIPFLMDEARHSNGSSATTLNRWRYMIENDMINPDQPLFWIAPGIGSAIAGAIGWVNP